MAPASAKTLGRPRVAHSILGTVGSMLLRFSVLSVWCYCQILAPAIGNGYRVIDCLLESELSTGLHIWEAWTLGSFRSPNMLVGLGCRRPSNLRNLERKAATRISGEWPTLLKVLNLRLRHYLTWNTANIKWQSVVQSLQQGLTTKGLPLPPVLLLLLPLVLLRELPSVARPQELSPLH